MSKKRKVNWKKVLPKLISWIIFWAIVIILAQWILRSFFEINAFNGSPNPVYSDENFFIVMEKFFEALHEFIAKIFS